MAIDWSWGPQGLGLFILSSVLANSYISRRRSNSVDFGVKRTFSVPRLQAAQSRGPIRDRFATGNEHALVRIDA
jgi:hypothetical protein